MKLYAAADIHGSQYRLNIALKQIEHHAPELVVICGDITQFGPGEVAKNFLNQIPVKVFAIPGNIDTVDVGPAITDSKAQNIDRKRVQQNGLSFIGIGGDLPAPLSTLEMNDTGFMKPLNEIIRKDTVLVTHVPPYGTKDRVFVGHYIGDRELRALVDYYKPRLVLCAHVHEDPGFVTVGSTVVVNCSIGKRTEGALIDINDTITVQMLE